MKHIYYFSSESVAKERKMTQPFPYRVQKKLIHLSEPGGRHALGYAHRHQGLPVVLSTGGPSWLFSSHPTPNFSSSWASHSLLIQLFRPCSLFCLPLFPFTVGLLCPRSLSLPQWPCPVCWPFSIFYLPPCSGLFQMLSLQPYLEQSCPWLMCLLLFIVMIDGQAGGELNVNPISAIQIVPQRVKLWARRSSLLFSLRQVSHCVAWIGLGFLPHSPDSWGCNNMLPCSRYGGGSFFFLFFFVCLWCIYIMCVHLCVCVQLFVCVSVGVPVTLCIHIKVRGQPQTLTLHLFLACCFRCQASWPENV